MPRFLGRELYGAKTQPVYEFAFEEETGGDHNKHSWVNASYALAGRITEAFATYGWCTRIRGVQSGGTVETLPTAHHSRYQPRKGADTASVNSGC